LEEALTATRNGIPPHEVIAKLAASSVLGEVLATGLQVLSNQPRCSEADLRAYVEGAGRAAAHQMEHNLNALGTIASAAPLLGLLGTVIGMIDIFGSQSGAGAQPVQLAHGISVALYNTAFGLIVAIPSLIFWRYFRLRVDSHLLTMELAADRFVRHLVKLRSK
jgi:biopolymer transport protein ExbB